jgi:hypothetical protein
LGSGADAAQPELEGRRHQVDGGIYPLTVGAIACALQKPASEPASVFWAWDFQIRVF